MKKLTIPTAILLAALAATACSDSADTGGAQSEPNMDQAPTELDGGGTDAPGEAQVDTAEQRDLIYTAELETSDPDPVGIAEQVWDTADSYGGFVTADQRQDRGDQSWAELTVRIPSEHFGEAMDELSGLAESETDRAISTEDVTGQAVDIEDRISTKSASLERVRELLDEADSVAAILDLEAELADREAELATLESQLADLEERIAYSTIVYTVTAPDAAPSEDPGYTGPENFVEGLGAGWSGAVGVLLAISVGLGLLLPFVPLLALALAAVFGPIWYVRRRRGAAARQGS
ncbi:DUF4349 domain-containing protein [Glycomyces salinus]|uniref:DUF4349 domain-containing protein n=1 Tax=Glycomyces salinus TaxID=980294 RepID=UPI0018EE12DB|nr:DUF4349 domain-containing protein [Glycomyces salinus]